MDAERVSPSFGLIGESKMLERRYSRVHSNLMVTLQKKHSKRKRKQKRSKKSGSRVDNGSSDKQSANCSPMVPYDSRVKTATMEEASPLLRADRHRFEKADQNYATMRFSHYVTKGS